MCAECHSTGLRKGYDAAADRFETRWSEIDVSCEACHGPGSRHVEWAREGSANGKGDAAAPANRGFEASVRDPNRGAWAIDPATGSARRTAPLPARSEVDTCARCHSRRTALVESDATGGALLDSHLPALLDAGLYHADGQIDGEVFEYGSFLQSRMHAEGVTCSDCHEPHSQRLRFAGNGGNAMCGTCHSPAQFDRPEHHHHSGGGAHRATQSVGCVDCHMPTRTYLGVDDRRDHSLRVPRPDLTLKIGTPNACNGCHQDRGAAWAQAAVVRWYGGDRSRLPHYGEAIAAGRKETSAAEARLLEVAADREVPAIARATALALLAQAPAGAPRDPANPTSPAGNALAAAARDPEPLIRLGAAQGAMGLEPKARLAAVGSLLGDSLRAVREETARALLSVPPTSMPGGVRIAFDSALAELRASLALAAERPEVRLDLGGIALARGELAAAEGEYRAALRLDPAFVPGYANLAEALRLQDREAEAVRILEAGLARSPRAAALHYALGLARIRAGQLAAALEPLRRAAALAPEEARFAQVLALAERELARDPQPHPSATR
jgi:tetratricopeptide (TPR) repeat protein